MKDPHEGFKPQTGGGPVIRKGPELDENWPTDDQ